MIEVLGWALVIAGAGFGIAAWYTDQRLQEHRAPDVPLLATLFVPIRWQRRFYAPEAHPLVTRVWRQMATMYGLAILGLVLVTAGGG